MPSQTVTVNFLQYTSFAGATGATQSNVYAFMITPLLLPVAAAATGTTYDVTFNLVSNINGATISGINVLSGQPPGYTAATLPSVSPTISFNNTGLTSTDNFSYEIVVSIPNPSVTGQTLTFTSDDPEMQIPPPNG